MVRQMTMERYLEGAGFRAAALTVLGVFMLSCVAEGTGETSGPPDLSGFYDSAHHWYDIRDEDRVIDPLQDQQRYDASDVKSIADNILLFQKVNGGWAKNYDMAAILTSDQREAVLRSRSDTKTTTFDNGATHSQVRYLAKAFVRTGDERYKKGCLDGIEFILRAQYDNGGWPQFFPNTSGYRQYITFNDGAMIGVMKVLRDIVARNKDFEFVDPPLAERIKSAFSKGIDCILRCQIRRDGVPTVWGQQHDQVTYLPRNARSFELASACSMESAEIVMFLMSLDHPSSPVVESVENAVRWFELAKIEGIRIDTIEAPKTEFVFHTSSNDRVVVEDSTAPAIWARFYELQTNRPLFANRDGNPVYSMAEVERERRTGYAWYTYDPAGVMDEFPKWKKRVRP